MDAKAISPARVRNLRWRFIRTGPGTGMPGSIHSGLGLADGQGVGGKMDQGKELELGLSSRLARRPRRRLYMRVEGGNVH